MRNLLSVIVAVLIAGCAATPMRRTVPVVKPLRLADRETVEKRIGEFRKLTEPLAVRGVLCYPRAVMESEIPLDLVFSNVKKLGFNRIQARISSEEELDGRLRIFLETARRFEIPVELALAQRDFFVRSRGNRLLRKLLPGTPDILDAVRRVAAFNESLPPELRLAGIVVFLEPNRFVIGSSNLPPDFLFAWNEKAYGPGLDNDLIVHSMFEMIRKFPEAAGTLPISVAVPDFLHEKALSGDLTIGTIADFCAVKGIRGVTVIDTGNRPSQLFSGISNELKAAPKGAKIVISVPVAGHSSVESGALRRRDWKDFTRSLGYLIRNAGCHAAFDGVVIGPLAHLQFILNEKD